ncbi:MAG: putative rane protein [Clostridiales bacterium]|jgi:AGZA family xanthine/uracil permease-like MFS transporter|nr:putative rane protein [Clostridiales bacterium]
MFEKFFKLKENKTNVKTEIIAGITTFMTMAYILAVNPGILAAAGMDQGAVFTATALAAVVGTLCMALFANYPFALAPGMGLNAFFAYTIVIGSNGKITWEVALTAVLVEGLIFLVMSLFSVREAIFNAIPMNIKHAVSVGIGLFIAFIGLQNAKIVINNNSTLVNIFDMDIFRGVDPTASNYNASFNDVGITVILALIGIVITAIFVAKKVKGGILWGILSTYLLGILCEVTGIYVPNVELGMYSLIPSFTNGLLPASMSKTFFKFDFTQVFTGEFFIIVFAFLFVDVFDTLGTLVGVSSKANMLDKNGKLPNIKGALLADAVATVAGACFGTSTTTTFVESASGVAEGGRTGLTAVVTAVLFGIALFFAPVFLAIPAFATAPAIIVVGFYMMGSVVKIDFNDASEGIPAFLTIIAMPFTYSIADGIVFGIVSYVIVNIVCGKLKKINLMMFVLAILFLGKFFAGAYFVQFSLVVIVGAILLYLLMKVVKKNKK